jgi:predicted heme/steroid binding protein
MVMMMAMKWFFRSVPSQIMSSLRQRKPPVEEPTGVQEEKNNETKTMFSILDILRMVLGIVLFNLMVSWWFTGTFTYKYNGKYIQSHFWHYKLLGSTVQLTDDQILLFNGTDDSKPIYIAINGTVWDVSSNPKTYGPGGSYHSFAGKDCARAFATNCLNHLTHDIRDIKNDEKRRLNGWIEWFDDKYFRVGQVIHEELTGMPPSRDNCMGRSR